MTPRSLVRNAVVATSAALLVSARVVHGGTPSDAAANKAAGVPIPGDNAVASRTATALASLESAVRQLSSPSALADAVHAYFAFQGAHPDLVRKPYLYFVDYGLPSTTPRGYVFDMQALRIVDGPFAVAHGRGSSRAEYGVPTKFSNANGSEASSLGLFLAADEYVFTGSAGGSHYHSVGVRLIGESGSFNDNAFARRVVAHGAPYVTSTRAGRSEGCPAMSPDRAQRLLPMLANGGVLFLFAPSAGWMAADPWVNGSPL